MRKLSPISKVLFHQPGKTYDVPYSLYRGVNMYTFASRKYTKYKQVLNYIANHPYCTRLDVITAIWPNRTAPEYQKSNRGYQSTLFAVLVHFDYVKYNRHFEYTITHKGKALLEPKLLKCELSKDNLDALYYDYGTNLKACNPKPTNKYVQHLFYMKHAGLATGSEICGGIKNPASHEFVQYCKLGFAEKLRNQETGNVYYRITDKGRDIIRRACA